MADGLNKAILIGNLGADPELRYTQSSQAVLRLRLATNESFLNKAGERQSRTEWHTVIVWGKRAEGLNKILTKGKPLYVEGRIQTRAWEGKDGSKRQSTEIVATNILLLGGGGRSGDSSAGPSDYDMPSGSSSEMPSDFPTNDIIDDDVPF
ncbi:MAG: single-stranded DNA-binding protein [Myxococcales bacterium]|nr:single-stranded DNA-binding protein [Myxococcales bacterium]